MAFIEPMYRSKPHITYFILLNCINFKPSMDN